MFFLKGHKNWRAELFFLTSVKELRAPVVSKLASLKTLLSTYRVHGMNFGWGCVNVE